MRLALQYVFVEAGKQDCKELAENVKKGLSANAQRMDENFTAHELELVNESSNIIVDQELAQLQDVQAWQSRILQTLGYN